MTLSPMNGLAVDSFDQRQCTISGFNTEEDGNQKMTYSLDSIQGEL